MADNAVRIQISNWSEHQHYGKRNPPWIKLHSKLLDNAEWGVLSGDAAKLLVTLWLMAAKAGTDGVVETTVAKLAWRTHLDSAALADLLNSLRDNEFLTYASAALATDTSKASASSIEVREAEKEELPVSIETGGAAPKVEPTEPEPTDNIGAILAPLIRQHLWLSDQPPPGHKGMGTDLDICRRLQKQEGVKPTEMAEIIEHARAALELPPDRPFDMRLFYKRDRRDRLNICRGYVQRNAGSPKVGDVLRELRLAG